MVTAILGGASNVWTDLDRLKALTQVDEIIATNDAGAYYPGELTHWVTLHPEKLAVWRDTRTSRGYPPAKHYWFHTGAPVTTDPQSYLLDDWGGSSGLLAVRVALTLKRSQAVLCGVPLEDEARHFFSDTPLRGVNRYRSAWLKHRHEIADSVRSMSGWTAQLLGEPDDVWLKLKENADGAQSSTREY